MRRNIAFVCYCCLYLNTLSSSDQYKVQGPFVSAFQCSLPKKSIQKQRDDNNKKNNSNKWPVAIENGPSSLLSATFNRRDVLYKTIKATSVTVAGIITAPIIPSTKSSALTNTNVANAIDFVPASPFFGGTYKDAIEILYAQRIAVDNIGKVISDGNIEEAGFKVMQLSAQTGTAGKIILDTFQEKMSSSSLNTSSSLSSKGGSNSNNGSIVLLQFLSCQKKFAILLDLCDECGISLQKAMKGKLGATAAVQIKTLAVVNDTKGAYDDFLNNVKNIERTLII